MIRDVWEDIPRRFPEIEIDAFVVMPNHIHGIILINPPPRRGVPCGRPDNHTRATTRIAPTTDSRQTRRGVPCGRPDNHTRATTRVAPALPSLGDVVGAYKSMTTVEYTRGVRASIWPPFKGKLWQRNYYEHIVRDEESLMKIRQYIVDNPAQWAFDRENPLVVKPEPNII